jgi:Sec7 domain
MNDLHCAALVIRFCVLLEHNADLHNPAIREDRRMTKAGFIGNNRGIAAGGNLDEAFLVSALVLAQQ